MGMQTAVKAGIGLLAALAMGFAALIVLVLLSGLTPWSPHPGVLGGGLLALILLAGIGLLSLTTHRGGVV